MKDLKYLAAYLVPVLTIFSLHERGIYSYTTVLLVFIIIPLIELFLQGDRGNLDIETADSKSKNKFFDFLLYLNIPLVFGILFYFLYVFHNYSISGVEAVGLILAVGTTFGSSGINVAHELGHRDEGYHKLMSKVLLLPSLYCHFIIEHNLGHHKNVGTEEDPASAKKNEPVYLFWFRSVTGSFVNAWKIEHKRLSRAGILPISFHNQMIWFVLIQSFLIAAIFIYGGISLTAVYLCTAIISFLLLETINYVEHYGLRRQRLANGRYERVEAMHSWNSNHELGRIFLYELTRHSDHHYLANKKYQLLDHHDSAKQLPYGYPASILLSLFPPLWFRIMNPRL